MAGNTEPDTPHYDVIVIGAGPGGAEAALAAAGAGARTLCLTINLDSVGYHPANPTLVGGPDDPRLELLAEMKPLGCRLPVLLAAGDVGSSDDRGRLVADRRLLGLAYKHELESTVGLVLRQGLVSHIREADSGFVLETALEERFSATAVVVAGGTFFAAEVHDSGIKSSGGRRGEISSESLVKHLQNKGICFKRTGATASPRLSGAPVHHSVSEDIGAPSGQGDDPLAGLPEDGRQLCELYGIGLEQGGNAEEQLQRLREAISPGDAWINRPSYSVSHLVLSARQVGPDMEAVSWRDLFFAGRLAGCCNFIESATTGYVAGVNAAAHAGPEHSPDLIVYTNLVSKLCELVAVSDTRPVTIRVPGPGC